MQIAVQDFSQAPRLTLSRNLSQPLFVAVYLVAVAASVQVADGGVIYPLDDTYIHLAMGRTLATSGVWGVQPSNWAAASSSPLFTLILAGLNLLWPSRIDFSFAPLLVNVLAGIGLIYAVGTQISGYAVLLLALPLIPLTLLGMEHTLDALLALVLVTAGIKSLDARRPRYWHIGLLSAAAVTCRYESLVLVLCLCLFAALRRRWLLLLTLGFSASVPLLLLGSVWHAHGGSFAPNSLVLKAFVPSGFNTVASKMRWMFTGRRLVSASTLTLLCGLTFALSVHVLRRHGPSSAVLFGLVAVVAGAAQLVAGSVGWLYRYEAWVLVLDAIACLTLLPGRFTVLLVAVILLPRAYLDARDTPRASQDRLREHFAPAAFIGKYFPTRTVVVNDIGVMAWTSPAPLLDIYGLASDAPVAMRKQGSYNRAGVADWAGRNNAQIAVLQACWPEIAEVTPAAWSLIETWRLPTNTVFNDLTIGFYAIDAKAAPELRRDLADYVLPRGVERVSVPAGANAAEIQRALGCQTS